MQTFAYETSTQQKQNYSTKTQYIFVLQLHDGRIVIGQAANAAKRIAAINSGIHPFVKNTLMVNRIVGVKPVTKERNLISVVNTYCDRYGSNRVVVV